GPRAQGALARRGAEGAAEPAAREGADPQPRGDPRGALRPRREGEGRRRPDRARARAPRRRHLPDARQPRRRALRAHARSRDRAADAGVDPPGRGARRARDRAAPCRAAPAPARGRGRPHALERPGAGDPVRAGAAPPRAPLHRAPDAAALGALALRGAEHSQPQVLRHGRRMSISPTDVSAAGLHLELPSALSLGQIVKARVLKHYEGGRYLVSLEGRERVVDSSVPLTTGELVRGRVIAVGDRIELQPLPPAVSEDTFQGPLQGKVDEPVDQLSATFAQFGLQLDDATHAAVMRSLKGAADPQATVLAAMTLAKLGLPQQAELIDAVQGLLRRRPAAVPAAGRRRSS